jgi:hypothetical protein
VEYDDNAARLDEHNITQRPFDLLTFITGPVRNSWERADEEEQQDVEADAFGFFDFEPKSQLAFLPYEDIMFMPIETETRLKRQALVSMYSNLQRAGKLKNFDKPLEFLDCFAMDRTTAHIGDCILPNCGLDTAPETLKRSIGEFFFLKKFAQQAYMQIASNDKIPVIGLRSGFALLLDNQTFSPILRAKSIKSSNVWRRHKQLRTW